MLEFFFGGGGELLCLIFIFVFKTSSKAQIAYFKITVFVYEEIAWFEVSMDNICRVKEKHSTEQLVEEVLYMLIGEFLGINNNYKIIY